MLGDEQHDVASMGEGNIVVSGKSQGLSQGLSPSVGRIQINDERGYLFRGIL